MADKLASGYKVKTLLGFSVTVNKHLGEGGQGDVYAVDYNGKQMALKWYKPNGMGKNPNAFYDNIKNNVIRRSPSDEFLWPVDITEWKDGTFGYVMGLRPQGYYEITDFMLCHVRFGSYKTIIDAALHIVTAFRKLHNAGYSYQDLNDGNFFVDPKTGKVLICDNDNVAPNKTETGILGKPRYMAPEIVMGKKMPDKLSDRFSMSIILFILFCMTHPLEGKRYLADCLTPALQEKLYGSDALFIMDKANHDNAPDPRVQKNVLVIWPCLPDYVQDLFQKAFSSTAIQNPNARPTELDWINTLVRFRSEIVRCQCGNEVFTQGGVPCRCERCKKKLEIPFRLEFAQYSIPGLPDSRIYRCQLGPCDAEEALNPMGRVLAKKDDPTKLGIRNLSKRSWNAVTSAGVPRKVAPDEVIPLKDGIQFTINEETVTIKTN